MSNRFPPTLNTDDLDADRQQILERMANSHHAHGPSAGMSAHSDLSGKALGNPLGRQSAGSLDRLDRLNSADKGTGSGGGGARKTAAVDDDRTIYTEGGFSQFTSLRNSGTGPPTMTRPHRSEGPPPSASSGYGPGSGPLGGSLYSGRSGSNSGSGSGFGSGRDGGLSALGSTGFGSGAGTVVTGATAKQSAVGSFLMKAPWAESGAKGRKMKPSDGTSVATGMTGSVVRQGANIARIAQESSSRRFQSSDEEHRMLAMAVRTDNDPRKVVRDRAERLSREVPSSSNLPQVDMMRDLDLDTDATDRRRPPQRRLSSSGRQLAALNEDMYEDEDKSYARSRGAIQQQSISRRDLLSRSPSQRPLQQSSRRFPSDLPTREKSVRSVSDRRPESVAPLSQHPQSRERPSLANHRAPSSRTNTTGSSRSRAPAVSSGPSPYHAPSFGASQGVVTAPVRPGEEDYPGETREYMTPAKLQKRRLMLLGSVFFCAVVCSCYGWFMVSRKMSNYAKVEPEGTVEETVGSTLSTKGTSTSDFATREAGLKNVLMGVIEPRTAFEDVGSPQSRALRWLVYEDEMQLEPPTNVLQTARVIQRFALTILYYATGGEGWTSSHNFLTVVDECKWNTIDGRGYFSGAGQCESDGMVTTVALWENNLRGNVPAELSALGSLKVLSLYRNQLKGQLPGRLAQLTNLHTLYLHDNLLDGFVDFMCPIQIQNFRSDCYDEGGSSSAMVTCSCCNVCCNRDRQCFQV